MIIGRSHALSPPHPPPLLSKTEPKKPSSKPAVSKTGKKLSGFMKFSKENRELVKEQNPGIAFGQIGKKLGEMWRELDPAEKEKWNA